VDRSLDAGTTLAQSWSVLSIQMSALAVSTAWSTSTSLSDPTGSSAILRAVQWLEGTVLGTIATTVAVIAVATVGLLALNGRIDIRRALTVVLGCFILFGSSSIVAGLQNLVREDGAPPAQVAEAEVSPLATLPQGPAGYDPYAGAAVPPR
jgi:type IV secretion system protein VirB2